MSAAVPVGAIIVGVAELIKLGNNGLQLYMQATQLAKMTEAEIDANFQKVKAEYLALPNPADIPSPV